MDNSIKLGGSYSLDPKTGERTLIQRTLSKHEAQKLNAQKQARKESKKVKDNE